MKKRFGLLTVAALIAALFPMGAAHAAPAIQLLNPSGYNANPELSSKTDLDGSYHFVAWVPSLPPNPLVEFEIQTAARTSLVTIDASRVGADVYEAFHNLAGLADGTYVVVARLYSNGVEVTEGTDTQTVSIRNGTLGQSNTVEITHPGNGGQLGFFSPPTGRPNVLMDMRASEGTQQVRVLYTVSRPGSEPVWQECGSGEVDAGGFARARCTLAEGAAPAQVTAVAAVANMTPPPAAPQSPADDAGDVHRVAIYNAEATRVVVNPESQKSEVAKCSSQVLSATAVDQLSRPLANPNFDVHAVGPNDQLQFGTGGMDTFQPPDKGPHSQESTAKCTDTAPDGRQGETNRVGQNDEKHIESRGEFRDEGTFRFLLRADAIGGTNIIVWVDADDDDLQDPAEASGGARIGWGQDPPAPVKQLFLEPSNPSATVGSCLRMTLTVKEGGNPVAGSNVDVHLSGPDSSVSFCTPAGGSPMRDPDAGEHVTGVHSDGTKHGEGELNSSGQFVFGVTSASQGETLVTGWLDEVDDDTLSNEPSTGTRATFGVSGERSISLDAGRRAVPRGRKVRLFGAVSGAEACEAGQTVRLKARRPGGRFRTIGTRTTDGGGEYAFRVRVRKTKDYRAVAPRDGICEVAKSGTVRVRAR